MIDLNQAFFKLGEPIFIPCGEEVIFFFNPSLKPLWRSAKDGRALPLPQEPASSIASWPIRSVALGLWDVEDDLGFMIPDTVPLGNPKTPGQ